MANNPTLLSMPLAQNGQKNVIPTTQATAGDGLFSQSTGFPAETSLPLGAGGVAPSREDFNGMANLLGGVAYYAQKGWQFQFDAGQDYFAGCIVRDTTDGKLYECLNDVAAGGSVPSADAINWKEFGVDTSTFANTDLDNLTQAGEARFANIVHEPDYTSGIAWSYSTAHTEQTYTAPSDGYLSYVLVAVASDIAYIKIDGNTVFTYGSAGATTYQGSAGLIFVHKGSSIAVRSNQTDGGGLIYKMTGFVFFPVK